MYESRSTHSHVTLVRNALWEPPDLLETCLTTLHPGGILVANAVTAKKVNPPFLLIYFREASPTELRGGYRQERDGYICTYNAFPEGKKEIREWEDGAIFSDSRFRGRQGFR